MNKKKKIVKKILNALRELAPLNNNKGPLIREGTRIHSKKDRKRKGRVEAQIIHPQMKWDEAKVEAINPEKFWDDWRDHRDGMRHNTSTDQLYHKWKGCCKENEDVYAQNHKIIKQIKIRKARKEKK